jgi:hypothetical protein
VFFGGGRFAGDQVDAMRRGFLQHRRAPSVKRRFHIKSLS